MRRITAQWDFPGLGSVYQVEGHGLENYADRPLYQFRLAASDTPGFEMFGDLPRALVSLVGAHYSGERGAGGTGVDTAAGWFMRAVGADTLIPVEQPERVLTDALADTALHRGPLWIRGRAMRDHLESRGYVVARPNHP